MMRTSTALPPPLLLSLLLTLLLPLLPLPHLFRPLLSLRHHMSFSLIPVSTVPAVPAVPAVPLALSLPPLSLTLLTLSLLTLSLPLLSLPLLSLAGARTTRLVWIAGAWLAVRYQYTSACALHTLVHTRVLCKEECVF